MKAFLREIFITLLIALVVFLSLNALIVIPSSEVFYSSMEPTLQMKQRLIIGKVAYRLHVPERGDIIIFHAPLSPEATYVKRIIGLPGESIEIKDGDVYINKNGNTVKLDEPYIKEAPRYYFDQYQIPEDNYFVLGDNRNNSNDSHNGWVVPRQDIIGKAWISIWPPSKWGLAANYPFGQLITSFIFNHFPI